MSQVLLDGDPVASLEEYRARGGGEAFAAAVAGRRGRRRRGGHRQRAARAGRRRVPHRAEVDGHPRRGAGPAVRGVQRRGGRAGHVQGPGAAAPRPVPGARGAGHRVVRGRRRGAPTSPPRRATSGRPSGSPPPSPRCDGRRAVRRPHASTLVLGPDEYLFGEEKALLEVIEGHDPLPRLLPPYEHGLFATDVQTGWQSVDAPHRRCRGASRTRRW